MKSVTWNNTDNSNNNDFFSSNIDKSAKSDTLESIDKNSCCNDFSDILEYSDNTVEKSSNNDNKLGYSNNEESNSSSNNSGSFVNSGNICNNSGSDFSSSCDFSDSSNTSESSANSSISDNYSNNDSSSFMSLDNYFDIDNESDNEFEHICDAITNNNDAIACLTNYDILNNEDENMIKWGGSKPGKTLNKDRDFLSAYNQLKKDYFDGKGSIYSEKDFEVRFRLKRSIFVKVYHKVEGNIPFTYRENALGKWVIHPLVRTTASLRGLAYGDAYDREDENMRLAKTTQANWFNKGFL